jgi:hypothetical protein
MTPIYTKTILLLSFMLVSSANSEETPSSNLTHQIQNSVNDILLHHEESREEDTEGSRFPELDPELVAILNEHTETENAIFLENRKKDNAARAEASATANTAKVLEHAEPGDRFQDLDFDLETKHRAQIWSDTKRHKQATGTKRLRGSS